MPETGQPSEAALACARRQGTTVTQRDFEEAIDRLQLGLRKEGRVMQESERRRVAWHEAGHALVALSVKHADPVHRVTIIPRSIGALGATLQLPTDDRYLMTEAELHDAETDVWYVVAGGATVVMGGTIVDSATTGPGEHRGPSIKGGTDLAVAAGDVVTIRPGVAHWVKAVDGRLRYLVVKVRAGASK